MLNAVKVDEIFTSSLSILLQKRGTKAKLAKELDLSKQFVSDLVSGRRYGSEQMRRKLAFALGYPNYEEFLDVGRKALGLPTVTKLTTHKLPPWLESMLNDLSSLDEHGQKAVKALVEAFKK